MLCRMCLPDRQHLVLVEVDSWYHVFHVVAHVLYHLYVRHQVAAADSGTVSLAEGVKFSCRKSPCCRLATW